MFMANTTVKRQQYNDLNDQMNSKKTLAAKTWMNSRNPDGHMNERLSFVLQNMEKLDECMEAM